MKWLSRRQILRKTIDYCTSLGIKEPTLKDLEKPSAQRYSLGEMVRRQELPKIITYDLLHDFGTELVRQKSGIDILNYFRHCSITEVLRDLMDINRPEYTLELLVNQNYLKSRQNKVYRITDEELLKDSLALLEKKYGKRKVEKLKKKLGIGEIRQDMIDDHCRRFRKDRSS